MNGNASPSCPFGASFAPVGCDGEKKADKKADKKGDKKDDAAAAKKDDKKDGEAK